MTERGGQGGLERERPALTPGVEYRDFGTCAVLAPPRGGSMLHLESDEYVLLHLMDGTRTEAEIQAAAGRPIGELLDDLREEGYLVSSHQHPTKRATVTVHGVEFSGFDTVIQAINRGFGATVFSVHGVLVMTAVAVCGFGVFVSQAASGARLTVSTAAPVLAVVALRVLGLVAVGPHETGHALVLAHNRRRVGRVGVGFYWGALTFYVDASQALFLPRRTRMLQSSAGVLADLVICGAAAMVAGGGGDATWAVVLREFAVLGYLNVLVNAVPLLELDGYWFLADALDRPTLQRDARQALAAFVSRRTTSRGLAAYAAASIVFGLSLMVLGTAAWWGLFGGLFLTLWHGAAGYKLLAAYLALPFVPMVIQLVAQPVQFLRRRIGSPAPTAGVRTDPEVGRRTTGMSAWVKEEAER